MHSPSLSTSTVSASAVVCHDLPDTPAAKSLLPEWCPFKLHPQLARALYAKAFTAPTPIQAQTLPLALKNKDVVGVAETVGFKSSALHAIRHLTLKTTTGFGEDASLRLADSSLPPRRRVFASHPEQQNKTSSARAHPCSNARARSTGLLPLECLSLICRHRCSEP